MLFNSVEFLIFFVIVTTAFFLLPKKARNYLLLAASYVFYAWWNWKLTFLIIFTTLVSFGAGLLISRYEKHRKLFLVIAVTVNVGLLLFFKYYNFFARGVALFANVISGNKFDFTLDILLPIGISFYSFQALSYVIDVYKKKTEPEKNFFIYALFVSFFPQLVAGPIERPEDLIPQLKKEHVFNDNDVIAGLKLMAIGFFEKIAVADIVGVAVNKVYENVALSNGPTALIATVLFSLQILCDFKGYSDIAKGVARVYGIKLSDNFDKPYSARSVREFWRRWHITLSTWFRDYLYIPLGGSHVAFGRYCINVAVVFAISGLWHGAAVTFLIWGVIHAVYQIVEKLVDKVHKPADKPVINVFRKILTFILVTLAWVVFRSNSLQDALTVFTHIFTNWSVDGNIFVFLSEYFNVSAAGLAAVAVILAVYFFYGKLLSLCDNAKRPLLGKIGKYAVFSLMIFLTAASFIYLKCVDVDSSFIYFQF
ncbi:MAG: MBOAT family protein [Clostridia bacterium]|nr:MBOAT family protein [Clostridia bacterium]